MYRLANALSHAVCVRTLDKCKVTGYTSVVKMRSVLHKGLRRLDEQDDPKGLPLPASTNFGK
jgi:hypothetical protein